MQNLTLSQNTQLTLMHALKGLGLRQPSSNAPANGVYPEMSEEQILQILTDNNTTVDTIYHLVKLAIWQQFQNDALTNQQIQTETALHRHTLKGILTQTQVGNFKIADKVCDVYLRNLTAAGVGAEGSIAFADYFALDQAAETVMMLMAESDADKNLRPKEKDEFALFWQEAAYTGYREWLQNDTKTFQPKLPYD